MARYDILPAMFTTPRGKSCVVYVREGTNDWNTANSCMGTIDEYGTASLDFTGDFLDIGGYLGTVALAVLLDHPGTFATIVEPIPENLEMIRRNLAANSVLGRARLVAGVVGTGEVVINYRFTADENALHHAFVGNGYNVPQDGPEHQSVTYPALSFAELAPNGVPWLKIDCEGGEWGILDQMTGVPVIVGEFHPVPLPDGSVGSRERLEAILGATHDITYGGPVGSPEAWGFRAVKRA